MLLFTELCVHCTLKIQKYYISLPGNNNGHANGISENIATLPVFYKVLTLRQSICGRFRIGQ